MASEQVVGDFVTLVRGITYKGTLVGKPGPALLGLGSIVPGGGFRQGDFKTYGGQCPENLMLYPGELFASLKGATKDGKMIGSVARVPNSVPSGRLTQDTVKLVFKDGTRQMSSFLYWVLRTPQYRNYCADRARGSAVVALSREDFLSYPVPEQTSDRLRLITLFDSIEQKIDLNRRMSETLEEMARALFKSWFVDFDPVKANAEGRDPEGMDADTAALFPRDFQDSELGSIPQDWKVQTVGALAEIVGGATPSTKENKFWDDGAFHWVTPKDLSNLAMPVLLDTERKITGQGLSQISSGLLPVGTVLLSSRAPIGYLAIVEVPTAVNQGFIAMKPCTEISNLFLLFWTKLSMEVIRSRANGSTFMEISKKSFRPIKLVVPNPKLMAHFDQTVRPLYERIVVNERQNKTLVELRDMLLPKLISGQLRVAEAERCLTEVTA